MLISCSRSFYKAKKTQHNLLLPFHEFGHVIKESMYLHLSLNIILNWCTSHLNHQHMPILLQMLSSVMLCSYPHTHLAQTVFLLYWFNTSLGKSHQLRHKYDFTEKPTQTWLIDAIYVKKSIKKHLFSTIGEKSKLSRHQHSICYSPNRNLS